MTVGENDTAPISPVTTPSPSLPRTRESIVPQAPNSHQTLYLTHLRRQKHLRTNNRKGGHLAPIRYAFVYAASCKLRPAPAALSTAPSPPKSRMRHRCLDSGLRGNDDWNE